MKPLYGYEGKQTHANSTQITSYTLKKLFPTDISLTDIKKGKCLPNLHFKDPKYSFKTAVFFTDI
jgi:hypothetical protein